MSKQGKLDGRCVISASSAPSDNHLVNAKLQTAVAHILQLLVLALIE